MGVSVGGLTTVGVPVEGTLGVGVGDEVLLGIRGGIVEVGTRVGVRVGRCVGGGGMKGTNSF